MNELNLENPIIVIYVNLDNMSPIEGNKIIENFKNHFDFSNVTSWIIPVTDQKTKIEIIWKGSKFSNIEIDDQSKKIEHVHKKLNKILELISDGTSDAVIKQKLRELSLNEILND